MEATMIKWVDDTKVELH